MPNDHGSLTSRRVFPPSPFSPCTDCKPRLLPPSSPCTDCKSRLSPLLPLPVLIVSRGCSTFFSQVEFCKNKFDLIKKNENYSKSQCDFQIILKPLNPSLESFTAIFSRSKNSLLLEWLKFETF